MPLVGLIFWLCSISGVTCGAAPTPSIASVQTAYDSQAAAGNPLHDNGLKVLDASCDLPKAGLYLCQISFTSTNDPQQRLYYDVVAVAWDGRQWQLKSGLCKR